MKEQMREMRRIIFLLFILILITLASFLLTAVGLMETRKALFEERFKNNARLLSDRPEYLHSELLIKNNQPHNSFDSSVGTERANIIAASENLQKYKNDKMLQTHRNSLPITEQLEENNDSRQHLTLDDILITIKTTQKFHSTRLKLIAQTWYNLAPNQTLFISDGPLNDADAPTLYTQTPAVSTRLHVTDCPDTHNRRALCCKMAWEFDAFLESSAKWWCHFDDDNYVNVKALVNTLSSYDHRKLWYLGRPSIKAPLEILNRDDVTQKIAFLFATGGAGFCISRALALQMMPIAGGGKLTSIGEKIRLPDDVTIGYIIEHLLDHRLTVLHKFHSHLESMQFLDQKSLSDQISLSYSTATPHSNLLSIAGLHPKVDPTRMLSLHCLLYPNAEYCPR